MPLSGSRAANCYPTDYPASVYGLNCYAKHLILLVGAQGLEPWTR
jgi:hypothetical protein